MTPPGRIRTYAGATSIVTGAASGIGRALAIELGLRKSHVVVADIQPDLAQQTADSVQHQGATACVRVVDVTDADAVEALVARTQRERGRLDYLFNNAGIAMGGPTEGFTAADWSRVIDVNLKGVAFGVQAAYPRMQRQGYGHIVNTASIGGLVPLPGTGAYVPTKYAVVGLSRALRAEARRHGVRVSALCPGVVRTPILSGGKFGRRSANLTERQLAYLTSQPRPAEPEHFARRALARVARNESIIVVPGYYKALWWADRVAPQGLDRVLAAVVARLHSKLESLK